MKTFALLAALCLAFPAAVAAQDNAPPDLSGIWVLDQARSDDFAAALRPAGGGAPPDGGRHPGGERGGGRHPGNRPSGDGPGPDQEEFKQRAQQAKREYQHLEIFQQDQEFDLTNGLDITQTYFTDGRDLTVWTRQGEMKALARWRGPVLVMEWRPGDKAPGRTRRFQLSEDGDTLTVTEERPVPGQDKPVKIRLVYDRQK